MHPYFNHIQLGYYGILPFLACIAAILMLGSSEVLINAFTYYSLGILAFMAGTLWRAGEQSKGHAILAVVPVIPFPLLALLDSVWILAYLAVAYWVVLWFEKSNERWPTLHKDYRKMRFVLSSIVFVTHLFMISQAFELLR